MTHKFTLDDEDRKASANYARSYYPVGSVKDIIHCFDSGTEHGYYKGVKAVIEMLESDHASLIIDGLNEWDSGTSAEEIAKLVREKFGVK